MCEQFFFNPPTPPQKKGERTGKNKEKNKKMKEEKKMKEREKKEEIKSGGK